MKATPDIPLAYFSPQRPPIRLIALLIALLLSLALSPLSAENRLIDTDYRVPEAAAWPGQENRYPLVIEATLAATTRQAEAGDVKAQVALGRWYIMPDKKAQQPFKPRDEAQSRQWFMKAAAQGDPEAAFYLTLFTPSRHTAPDAAMLKAWEDAAGRGSTVAAVTLASHHAEQIAVDDEMNAWHANEAIRYLRQSAADGWLHSAETLAAIYYPENAEQRKLTVDIVSAYAWRAILHRGLKDLNLPGNDAFTGNLERLRHLDYMMLPSEKKRALALIRAWPKTLPPAVRLERTDDERHSEFATQQETLHGFSALCDNAMHNKNWAELAKWSAAWLMNEHEKNAEIYARSLLAFARHHHPDEATKGVAEAEKWRRSHRLPPKRQFP